MFWNASLRRELDRLREELVKRQAVSDTFSPLVPAALAERLLEQGIKLDGETRDVIVLSCVMEGFSAAAGAVEPRQAASALNRFYQVFASAVEKQGGSIEKLWGPLAVAVFNAPLALDQAREKACQCAWDLSQALKILETQSKLQSRPVFQAGTGLAVGPALAAHLGPQGRRSWALTGLVMERAVTWAGKAANLDPHGPRMVIDEELRPGFSPELRDFPVSLSLDKAGVSR